jgi:hypothetical protein
MYVLYYKLFFFIFIFINLYLIFIKFTQDDFRKFITKWIITDDQPFTTLENKYFQQMIKFLNPNALIPSADTLKKNIMEIFEKEQIKMKKSFQVSFKHYIKYIKIFFQKIFILHYILTEYTWENFICFRCMNIYKWLFFFSNYNTLDYKRLGTLR